MIRKGGTGLMVQKKQKKNNNRSLFREIYTHKLDGKTKRTAQGQKAVHS